MHKKGIIACSVFGVLVLGALYSGASFAAQTCTTDEQTGQVTCTNSATASVTVAAACSFSRTTGSGEYAGILANNASIEVTGSTFSTTCNDSGGYAIYAIGYGNNTFGNTDLIFDNDPSSSNNITTNSTSATGTSYWQMKLAAGVGNHPVLENGYGSYSAVPSTYTKVASYASADMGTAQTVTATYKAAASATQPAGTYTGAVKYTMVHPNTNIPNQPYDCVAGNICYFPNAGNTVADTMGNQSISSSDTSATLWASNFKRPGYGFAGWSDAYDYVVNEGSESNPDASIYGPNEDIEFTAGQYSGTDGGLALYAVWVPVATDASGNELTFQTNNLLTATLADGTTLGNKNNGFVTALRDERDNQVYAVAKLKDGNYWMIENLRLSNYYLDSNGTVQDVSFAASNTQGLGTGANNVFVGLANPEVEMFSNNTTANSLYSTNGNNNTHNITYSSNDPGNLGYRMPRYRNDNTNSVASKNNNVTVANMADTNQNVYSYGNYYSWAAAIANTMHYTSYSASDAAGTSICPSGWRLPMGGRKASVNNSDFWKLSRANIGADPANFANDYFYYTGNPEGVDASRALRSFPNNFLYSGNAYSSNIYDRGSYGLYWSSSANNAYYAHYLYLVSSGLYPGTGGDVKFYGFTVRCVVAPSP